MGDDDAAGELVLQELEHCLLQHVGDLVALEGRAHHHHGTHYWHNVVRGQCLALFPEKALLLLDDGRGGDADPGGTLLALLVAVPVAGGLRGGGGGPGSGPGLDTVQLAHRGLLQDELLQAVGRGHEADVRVLLDLAAHPPVRVKLLKDVQIVADFETDDSNKD